MRGLSTVLVMILTAGAGGVAADSETPLLTRVKLGLGVPDPAFRLSVLETLESLGTDAASAVPLILPLLKDTDPVIRMKAATVVAKTRVSSPETLRLLREAVGDTDPTVREEVAVALVAIGMGDSRSVAAIATALNEADSTRVDTIIDTLALHERTSDDVDLQPIRDVLVRLAGERRGTERRDVISALAALPPQRGTTKRDEADQQEADLLELTDPAVDDPAMARVLIAALKDKESGVVVAAASVAEKWYTDTFIPIEVAEELAPLVVSPDNQIRYAVIGAFGKSKQTTIGDDALIASLRDADHTNRLLAVQGLAKRQSIEAISELVACIGHPAAGIRAAVANTLQSYGVASQSAGPAVAGLLRDPADSVRLAGATALEAIGSIEQPVRTEIVAASNDLHPNVRAAAVKAIGAQMLVAIDKGQMAAADQLLSAAHARLKDRDDDIVKSAATVIAATAPRLPSALSVLREIARSDDIDLQLAATEGLERFGMEAAPATPELVRLLSSSTFTDVRARAARTFARIRPLPSEAVAPLTAMLADEESCNSVAAIDALSRATSGVESAYGNIVAALIAKRFYCPDSNDRLRRAIARLPAGLDEELLNAVRDFPDKDPRNSIWDSGPSRKERIIALVETARRERGAHQVALIKPDGKPIQLEVRPDEVIIAVASWCPYSRQLRDQLRRPDIARLLPKKKVHFVFESSEWGVVYDHVVAQAKEEGRTISEEEANAIVTQLKTRSGGGPLFDAAFLDDLPGDWYFLPPGYKQDHLAFPSAYSVVEGRFAGSVNDALEVSIDLPKGLLESDRKSIF
jgi:HEAT repeats